MDKLEQLKEQHPLRYNALAGILIFIVGVMIGAAGQSTPGPQVAGEPTERVVTKTVTKEVTPQACHDVLALDDEIFMTLGEHLGAYDFAGATDYIGGVRAERLSLYAGCVEA